jgi:hypothetical protein
VDDASSDDASSDPQRERKMATTIAQTLVHVMNNREEAKVGDEPVYSHPVYIQYSSD